MKTTIFILISAMMSGLQGQPFDEIQSRLHNLTALTEVKLDSTGFSQLPDSRYGCGEGEEGEFWHVEDLNGDALQDVIYSGPCNPYYQTAVFLNNGKELELIYESPGQLAALENDSQETKIDIIKASCCCDYFSDLIRLRIHAKNQISIDVISFHFDTQIETVQDFGEKVLSGKLRTLPVVQDSIRKDPCDSEMIIGNQLEEIKDKQVTVLARKNGWDMVLVSNDKGNSIIGWIKEE